MVILGPPVIVHGYHPEITTTAVPAPAPSPLIWKREDAIIKPPDPLEQLRKEERLRREKQLRKTKRPHWRR